uniref:Serine protease 54 n=1 Tax=Molossus molossus TaxID=27622 RepID=A0A7J8CAI0_MOLMO|nr:serine protease 54 [Molossus molossus]
MESHVCNRKSHDDEYPEKNLRERHGPVSLKQIAEKRMWQPRRGGDPYCLLGGPRKPTNVPATGIGSVGAERTPVPGW